MRRDLDLLWPAGDLNSPGPIQLDNEDLWAGDIPFPETMVQPTDGSPWPEVVAGSVDENLDMFPGAHVILHLHVSGVPLIRHGRTQRGRYNRHDKYW